MDRIGKIARLLTFLALLTIKNTYMNTELHDKAWKLLEDKGFTLDEKMMVRSHFASAYKEDYPNMAIEWNKGEVEYYHSEIDMIKSFRFDTEKEVILANAIYENMDKGQGVDGFVQLLKFTFKIIGVDSKWNN